jgi:hypothetical protein
MYLSSHLGPFRMATKIENLSLDYLDLQSYTNPIPYRVGLNFQEWCILGELIHLQLF